MNANVATVARVYGELCVLNANDPDAVVEHNVQVLRNHGLDSVAGGAVRLALAADPVVFKQTYVGAMLRYLEMDAVICWVEDHDLEVVPYLKIRAGGQPFTVALPVHHNRVEAIEAVLWWAKLVRAALGLGGLLRVTFLDLTFLQLERAPWRS